MYNSFHFGGGGVLCLSYIGILRFLEQKNHNFRLSYVSGNSAGAVMAYLVSIGYTSKELMSSADLLITFKLDTASIVRVLRLFSKRKGIVTFDTLTFEQHYNRFGVNLYVGGTSLTEQNHVVFSYRSHPDMSVLTSLLISTCIPLIFTPIEYDSKIYVDGSITDDRNTDIVTPSTLCVFVDVSPTTFSSPESILSLSINAMIGHHTYQKCSNIVRIRHTDCTWKNSITLSDLMRYILIGYETLEIHYKKYM